MAATILKLVFLMFSNFGYWSFLKEKTRINAFFLPAFTIAAQFVALFSAGLLNFLSEAALMIYLGGIALAFLMIYQRKMDAFRPFFNWGYAFLLLGTVLICFAVRGKLFYVYDNFSHWALVAKNMLETDRFPSFKDTFIIFTSYPLGSSAYIYYFCHLSVQTESTMMLAQAFMDLCMLLPLFCFVKKHRGICTLLIVSMSNFLLSYIHNITSLTVDTLFPLTGIAAILFVYVHWLSDCQSEKPLHSIFALPLLCLTCQIKNTGLFFSLIAAGLLLYCFLKQKRLGLWDLVTCASPLIISFLWSRHYKYVFSNASASKHAMSLENYSSVFSAKSIEDILEIVNNAISHAFSRTNLLFLLAWILVLAVITYFGKRDALKRYGKLILSIVALYVVYSLGLAAMYVFSMPLHEAQSLASIDRYLKTNDVVIYYLLLCYGVTILSQISIKRLRLGSYALLLALVIVTWRLTCGGFAMFYQEKTAASRINMRNDLQSLLTEYRVPDGRSYFICLPVNDGFINYVCTYLTSSASRTSAVISNASKLNAATKYDYVIIMDQDNPIIEAWIAENYPEQVGQAVISIPKIK